MMHVINSSRLRPGSSGGEEGNALSLSTFMYPRREDRGD